MKASFFLLLAIPLLLAGPAALADDTGKVTLVCDNGQHDAFGTGYVIIDFDNHTASFTNDPANPNDPHRYPITSITADVISWADHYSEAQNGTPQYYTLDRNTGLLQEHGKTDWQLTCKRAQRVL